MTSDQEITAMLEHKNAVLDLLQFSNATPQMASFVCLRLSLEIMKDYMNMNHAEAEVAIATQVLSVWADEIKVQ